MTDSLMRKRFAITLMVLFGVAGTSIIYRALVSIDERFEGEPLEFWLRGGQPPPQYLLKTNWSQQKAEEAVRHLGSDAIPVLLRKLRAADSPLKSRLIYWARKLPLVRIDPVPAARLNIAGYEGFKILGGAGRPAIPELVRIVEANRSLSSRCYSIGALGCVGSAATNATPSLLKWLADTNATIRWNTALTLGRIRAQPDIVVPALIKLIEDGDNWVRHEAINALGAFGPQAVSATPALTQRLADPNDAPLVRGVLRRIAPQADAVIPVTGSQP